MEQAKLDRINAKRTFTRKVNVLKEHIVMETASSILRTLHENLKSAFGKLESTHEIYLSELSKDSAVKSEQIENEEEFMLNIERTKINVESELDKLLSKDHEETCATNIKVKPLSPPVFSGKIKEYGTFKKDYLRLMFPLYGSDAYALKSCLSGEALDCIEGVEDNYNFMFERLDAKYGNATKLTEIIVCDLKKLKPVPEGDSKGFIVLVDAVQKAFLNLSKVNAENEMSTTYMMSLIEKLLPKNIQHEWVKISLELKETDNQIKYFLEFLIKEKNVCMHLDSDLLSNAHKVSANLVLEEGNKNDLRDAILELRSSQSMIVECLANMTQLLKGSSESKFNNNELGFNKLNYNMKCALHESNTHSTLDCHTFKKLNNYDKFKILKTKGLCYKCLMDGHTAKFCRNSIKCRYISNGVPCNAEHHTILHEMFSRNENVVNTSSNLVSRDGMMLMVGEVKSGTNKLNVLYDPGSNVSFICHDAAKRLGLKSKNDVAIDVVKVGNDRYSTNTKEYTVPLHDLQGNVWNVTACGIDDITSPVERVKLEAVSLIFPKLKLPFDRPHGRIDMLIGIDYCGLMPRVIETSGNLQLMENSFGMVIRGSHPLISNSSTSRSHASIRVNHIGLVNQSEISFRNVRDVKEDIRQYFEIENLGTSCVPKCSGCKCGNCTYGDKIYNLKEERELELITKGLSFDEDLKQWVVHYPWIKDPSNLPNNYNLAMARLMSTEKRLSKLGPEYCDTYQFQIKDMVDRGVAKKLSDRDLMLFDGPIFYLPHMEVLKVGSKSTPVRIVFNGSAKYLGHSLNEYLAKGPDILNSLLGILLRFRENHIGITCDISKMYNSVRLSEPDQHCHRFLWRDFETKRTPDHYVLTHVPFGDRPSGTIAITALKLTAIKYKDSFPEASHHIIHDAYVDDLLISIDKPDSAERIKCEIDWIMNQGGFKIKEWKQSEKSDESNLLCSYVGNEKVLGVNWNPRTDAFSYKIKLNFSPKVKNNPLGKDLTKSNVLDQIPENFTKRSLLRQLASQYDPIGLIIPISLQGKLLMRKLTCTTEELTHTKEKKIKYDWDDPLPDEIKKEWIEYFLNMFKVEDLIFTRCVKPQTSFSNPVLVVFSDGSHLAYGSCAYIRWEMNDGSIFVSLLMAKARLAPLRQLTIPRIELCGALVGARLREFIEKEMNYNFSRIFHITDSTIVCAQIQKESHGFNVFTATKIAEIQSKSDTSEWWWTPRENNPADMTTRITMPYELNTHSVWQKGPHFLYDSIETWPISKEPVSDIPDRLKTYTINTCTINNSQENLIDLTRYNDYKFMLRVTSRVLKVVKQKTLRAALVPLTSLDINEAEVFWIKCIQVSLLPNWQNRFRRLGPSLNSDGVIIVGERIPKWLKYNFDRNEYILLPSDHLFTRLYVRYIHNLDHAGIETTLAKIQNKFWIPKVRKLIKSTKKSCILCRKLDKVIYGQKMGQLPNERVRPSAPFMNSALDLFGPFLIRDTVKRRCNRKTYGLIFNCLSTRAVHLDLVEGYSTKEFLDALRRFVSIRGFPSFLYSDNGSQLKAANKELKSMLSNWNLQTIKEFGYNHGCEIKWNYTKSCDSPWENGCSEALIKSVKRSIVVAIGESILTFSELQTSLFEISELLNQRPIGIKPGCDIELGKYLCPNDLLLGRTSKNVPIGVFNTKESYGNRLKFNQMIVSTFWKKWYRDYFPTLLIRPKWHVDRRNLCKGDIVLVQDSNILKGFWKMAEVISIDKSKDEKVRNVNLRYKPLKSGNTYNGEKDIVIKRSAHRIVVLLPIEER